MKKMSKYYWETGDIASCVLDLENEKLSFFKNMVQLFFRVSSGDLLVWTSTPITQDDIDKVIPEIKEKLESLIEK